MSHGTMGREFQRGRIKEVHIYIRIAAFTLFYSNTVVMGLWDNDFDRKHKVHVFYSKLQDRTYTDGTMGL